MADGRKCTARRKDGSPCTLYALASAEYCFAHSPAATEGRKRGGKATGRSERAVRMLPSQLRPVLALLLKSIRQTHEGTLTPTQAAAIAALAGAICKVMSVGQLEERVAALETMPHERQTA